MHSEKPSQPNFVHMVYGLALMVAGLGMFIKTPIALSKLAQFSVFANNTWFSYFCLYLMGIILIGGGARKISQYFKSQRSAPGDKPAEPNDS